MINYYYSPLEIVLLIMSMAFCTFFGIILGYKLSKYENKKIESMFSNNKTIDEPFPKKIKRKNEEKKNNESADTKIKMPKNMEW